MKNNIKTYYNEWDKDAAAWLRQLIKDGLITDGVVDERSITEVSASDIRGFDRVHWFAGIGTWDYCLNEAGWGDRPIWTASLPCQPFSAAGKGLGKTDERHLLPHFIDLVRECKPVTCFGEQVSAAIRHGWLDDLHAEMEAQNYAVGHCVFGAHSIGAAHIRQRLYWVAHASRARLERRARTERADQQLAWSDGMACGVGIANSNGRKQGSETAKAARYRNTVDTASGIDWLYCRDNKYRPIKSGSIKMAHGVTTGMVCRCDKSEKKYEEQQEEIINDSEHKADTGKILSGMQQENGEEENKFSSGGSCCFQKTEVLRQGLHGQSIRRGDEGSELQECSQAIKEDGEKLLRGVWKNNFITSSSCGRKSFEQLPFEFDDIVFSMPQGSTLKTFFCADGAYYLQTLRKTSNEEQPLLDSQYPLSEVWRSLDDEEKNRVRVAFSERAWIISEGIKPLVNGSTRTMVYSSDQVETEIKPNETAEAHAMRLKGYGNAIVAGCAIEFIKTFMEYQN